MRPGKLSPTLVLGGVDGGTVSENHSHTINGFIAVLLDSATHAAGIIGEDAAYLGAVDGSGIRTYLPVELGQESICLTADNSRFELNLQGMIKHPEFSPPPTQPNKNRVGNSLTGKTSARSPKGYRQFLLMCLSKDELYLLLIFDIDDNLRNQPIETGIGTVGERPQRIGDDIVTRNSYGNLLAELFISFRQHRSPLLLYFYSRCQ